MDNYNDQQPFSNYTVLGSEAHPAEVSKKFMAGVFAWMFAALGISALFAFLFATTPSLMGLLMSETSRGASMTPLGWIIMFAPFGFVLLIQARFARLSPQAIGGLFIAFSAILGISLSFVLLAYTASSVVSCFLTASVMFGIMAVLGYTTNQDLTSFGRILMMGVIGIVVAMVINWFMHSAQLDYLISMVGVAVFTGLTAYDVQKIKRIGAGAEYEGTSAAGVKKLAIMGAMSLYLDFINLFLFLLRLFGRRR